MSTFGANLKQARAKAGFTQKQLAELVGISENAVKLYEADKRRPRVPVFAKLTEALSSSPDELLHDIDEPFITPGGAELVLASDVFFGEADKLSEKSNWRVNAASKRAAMYCTEKKYKSRIYDALAQLNIEGLKAAAEVMELIAGNPNMAKR